MKVQDELQRSRLRESSCERGRRFVKEDSQILKQDCLDEDSACSW